MMRLGDRIRAWLRGEGAGAGRRAALPERSGSGSRSARRRASASSLAFDGTELLAFATSRQGVEIYLEPRTRLYGTSVLLVADDGEYLRRPVPDAETARRFCVEHGIPLYDAARTGYPRRVRDYDRGVRPERIGLDDMPPWPGDDEPGPPPPPTGV